MRVLHPISTLFLIISSILLSSSSINNNTLTYAAKPDKKVITKEFLNNICSKSLDPTRCMDVFKNQIGHPLDKTTFLTLAIIPITLAQYCAKEAQQITDKLWYPGPPNRPKDLYLWCRLEYGNVLVYLQNAKKYMKKNNKSKVKSYASKGIKSVNICDQSFAEPKPKPTPKPPSLENVNKRLIALCSIIMALC
ncbi:hypothetical protein ABFX02_05G136800 [Erythranthe guttata]